MPEDISRPLDQPLKRYHGVEAVDKAIEYYKVKREDVPPEAIHLIMEEGFVPGVYTDTKGIATEGVGLTGDLIGKNFFTEVFPMYVKRAEGITPEYGKLSDRRKKAILSGVYRGDLKASHNTAKLMREGKWKEAAKEYLDHGDYKASKKKNEEAGKIVHGVQLRMEGNASAFSQG